MAKKYDLRLPNGDIVDFDDYLKNLPPGYYDRGIVMEDGTVFPFHLIDKELI